MRDNMRTQKNNHSHKPCVLVFSTLFPNKKQPNAGLFIRERMFRVSKELPLLVVSPVPWFPLQGIIRLFKPHFRPALPAKEVQQDIEVFYPKFFCIPGVFKSLDGLFLAISTYYKIKRLHQKYEIDIIDAHFGYPDGYAATLIGKWLNIPVTITLRGTEKRHSETALRKFLLKALNRATKIFSVANSLKQLMISLGAEGNKILVVGNGVDLNKFRQIPKVSARHQLGLSNEATVLVTVGGLVERKGFHRVLACLPDLVLEFPNVLYLIVGGASAEGNWETKLKQKVADLGLESHVIFFGARPPDELKVILSASDLFVLSTRNEGWANVFLEAMACGLPIVTTDVGGNSEVVSSEDLGMIVPFGDQYLLKDAIHRSLIKEWDIQRILNYAKDNSWDKRVETLSAEFQAIYTTKVN